MAEIGRLLAVLATAALLGASACATGTTDVDSGVIDIPDAPVGQPDAPVGQPDAPVGQPDAYVPPTPDAYVPPAPDASGSGTPITITQSTSQSIASLNSVSCNNEIDGHAENSYYRVFTLSTHGITSQFDITSVEVGIEDAISGTGGQQPATVYLHTLSGAVATANLTQIGTAAVSVSDQALSTIDVNVTGTAPAGSTLVVEFLIPDGQTDGHFLFVGSNTATEDGPTYIRAPDCSVADMSTTASIGEPDMHWVLNVTGNHYP